MQALAVMNAKKLYLFALPRCSGRVAAREPVTIIASHQLVDQGALADAGRSYDDQGAGLLLLGALCLRLLGTLRVAHRDRQQRQRNALDSMRPI